MVIVFRMIKILIEGVIILLDIQAINSTKNFLNTFSAVCFDLFGCSFGVNSENANICWMLLHIQSINYNLLLILKCFVKFSILYPENINEKSYL